MYKRQALGFLYWHRHAADWIALETGLGGRLDSTNVVTPAVSVIVSIGLDHQAILGDTLEAIAFEKAGIIKPGRPVVLGKLPPPAREVILKVAEERESPVWEFGREIVLDGDTLSTPAGTMRRPEPQLVGVWQGHNAALAISALQLGGLHLDESTALAAVQNADIPGRFQRLTHLGKDVILDGAHNPDSADALARTLRQAYPGERFTLVTNMLAGHEVATFYASLKDLISEAIVVPIDFHRARPVSETVALLQGLGVTATGMDNQELGLRQAAEGQHRVLVTGSFYLVGEVGRLVGK